jgi:hypothetical protein
MRLPQLEQIGAFWFRLIRLLRLPFSGRRTVTGITTSLPTNEKRRVEASFLHRQELPSGFRPSSMRPTPNSADKEGPNPECNPPASREPRSATNGKPPVRSRRGLNGQMEQGSSGGGRGSRQRSQPSFFPNFVSGRCRAVVPALTASQTARARYPVLTSSQSSHRNPVDVGARDDP